MASDPPGARGCTTNRREDLSHHLCGSSTGTVRLRESTNEPKTTLGLPENFLEESKAGVPPE